MRLAKEINVTAAFEAYLDKRTTINDESGCWEWTGHIGENGYGRAATTGQVYYAHRVSYTRHKGQIPAGMVIDHLCRNRRCINPGHLEAVTDQTNVLRGESFGARANRENQCYRGHLHKDFARRYQGRSYCRACAAIGKAAYKARQQAKRELVAA